MTAMLLWRCRLLVGLARPGLHATYAIWGLARPVRHAINRVWGLARPGLRTAYLYTRGPTLLVGLARPIRHAAYYSLQRRGLLLRLLLQVHRLLRELLRQVHVLLRGAAGLLRTGKGRVMLLRRTHGIYRRDGEL